MALYELYYYYCYGNPVNGGPKFSYHVLHYSMVSKFTLLLLTVLYENALTTSLACNVVCARHIVNNCLCYKLLE